MDIKAPSLGESITEATVANWLKKKGEYAKQDEPIVELETDKITIEVNAPMSGIIDKILVEEGKNINVGGVLGSMKEGKVPAESASSKETTEGTTSSKEKKPQDIATEASPAKIQDGPILSPAAQKIATERKLDPKAISGTGKDGRLTKEDVMDATLTETPSSPVATPEYAATTAREKRVKMTRLRQRIAQRLKEAQETAAMLATFNEVDMGPVITVRARYKEAFEKKHGVKLGFMSFFTKAAIAVLQEIPSVNAEIDGDEIVYKNYYNIGIAVGTSAGLVVPVIKNADQRSFAEIEQSILAYAAKAHEGKLSLEDMSGGTFTITNGGVYGSLMSTPILNPPQSGILGLHKIDKRAVVVNDEIVIRSMMYIALTYDHRIIDGKEAVTFLVKLKEYIEDPERLLIDV